MLTREGRFFKFWPIEGMLIQRGHLFEWGTNSRIYSKSSLQDLFIIHFCVKYSDQLMATGVLKFPNFGFKSVRLSLQFCKILLQFVTFMLGSCGGYLGFYHVTGGSSGDVIYF